MVSRTVKTKEELKKAKEDDIDQIIVTGSLAKKLRYKSILSRAGFGIASATPILLGGHGGSAILRISEEPNNSGQKQNYQVAGIIVSVGIALAAIITSLLCDYQCTYNRISGDVIFTKSSIFNSISKEGKRNDVITDEEKM